MAIPIRVINAPAWNLITNKFWVCFENRTQLYAKGQVLQQRKLLISVAKEVS